jgi:hypothetical protein
MIYNYKLRTILKKQKYYYLIIKLREKKLILNIDKKIREN